MKRSLVFAAIVASVCGLHAADRAEITFADARIFPESLTSTKNGDLYFGSLGQDAVYRAASKDSQATAWIKPKSNGLTTVLGVFADEKAGVLWVCASASGGRNGAPGGKRRESASNGGVGLVNPGGGKSRDRLLGRGVDDGRHFSSR